jgi:hypothetical protein
MPEAFELLLCRPPASQLRPGDQHQPAYPAGCCAIQIGAEAAGTGLDIEIDDVIAAILMSRFSCRTVPEICAMGGITVEDFTSSVA